MHNSLPSRCELRSSRPRPEARRIELENASAELFAKFTLRSRETTKTSVCSTFTRALQICHLDRVALWEFANERDELVWLYQKQSSDAHLIASRTKATDLEWARPVLSRAETVIVGDKKRDDTADQLTVGSMEFLVVLPLCLRGVVFGALIFSAALKPRTW